MAVPHHTPRYMSFLNYFYKKKRERAWIGRGRSLAMAAVDGKMKNVNFGNAACRLFEMETLVPGLSTHVLLSLY